MAKTDFHEFKEMIDHAVDREELEDIQRMILEASDLTFSEKDQLGTYLSEVYKKRPELRT